ncbi:hypothetical protein [Plastoroseomonas arctica]|uniref:Uncharacterized protein n=1 Tax=Plastoroseomonas arctica TaxID=1509237 RepID=A0AAF1JZ78_9PROT|nr:hypothetical protein [Plastoroseomonas arctica]MBR0656485.1 hypothetical protein [Plastoroseomonas arctica]
MAVQIYLIHLRTSFQQDEDARGALADLTLQVGGFVLMATNAGSLIAAFDEQWVGFFRQHRAVEFCGAVNVDPSGAAASKLRDLFAANVAAQLAGRPAANAGATGRDGAARHRPLRWHRPSEPPAMNDSGISISTRHHARHHPGG